MQPELTQLLPGYLQKQKDKNCGTPLFPISLQQISSRLAITVGWNFLQSSELHCCQAKNLTWFPSSCISKTSQVFWVILHSASIVPAGMPLQKPLIFQDNSPSSATLHLQHSPRGRLDTCSQASHTPPVDISCSWDKLKQNKILKVRVNNSTVLECTLIFRTKDDAYQRMSLACH